MALPSKELLRGLVSKVFYGGRACSFDTIVKRVKKKLEASDFDLKEKNRSGTEFAWIDRLKNVLRELKREKLVSMTKSKRYGLTEAGKKIFSDETPNVEEVPSEETSFDREKKTQPDLAALFVAVRNMPEADFKKLLEQLPVAPNVYDSSQSDADKLTRVSNHDERLELLMLQSMRDDQIYSRRDFKNYVGTKIDLSDARLNEKCSNGDSKWENAVDWAVHHLMEKGFIERPQRNRYRITEAGKKFLAAQ